MSSDTRQKSLIPYLLMCGFFIGLAESIYLLRTTLWDIETVEIIGLLFFAGVLYGLAGGVLGIFLKLVPFLRFFLKVPRIVPLLVGILLMIVVMVIPVREPRFAAGKAGAENQPNLLFITLDTMSSRNMSLYGYHRDTTPKLNKRAADGVVFEQAISVSNWTLASHSSMFTGLFPSEHGATYRSHRLPTVKTTLAEILAKRGYRTAGFIGGPYCSSIFGLSQGFQYYDEQMGSLKIELFLLKVVDQFWEEFGGRNHKDDIKHLVSGFEGYPHFGKRPGDKINRRILGYLAENQNLQPYFLFINYFDPHQPYVVPSGYKTLFRSPFCPSPSDSLALINKKYKLQRHVYFGDEWGTGSDEFVENIAPLYTRLGTDSYDALIRYTDDVLDDLLNEMSSLGLLENTYIIITADHGESPGTHQLWGHDGLYDEIMHVPLVIIGPDVPAGKRVKSQVSTHDLFPTMLRLMKIDDTFPEERDLSLYWTGDEQQREEKPVYGQFYRSQHLIDFHGQWFDCDAFMIRSPEWKITTRTNGVRRKYNLLSDPLETNNLSKTTELTFLDTLLDHFAIESVEAIETFTPAEISEEDKAKLRAVGYIQ